MGDEIIAPTVPISQYERPLMDRVADLETAVFGNPRQRVPGLIDSLKVVGTEVSAIKEMVIQMRDNRLIVVQILVQVVALLGAAAALIVALQ